VGKFSVFGYVFVLLFLAAISVGFISYKSNCELEFEKIRLGAIVNNATDSAVREAVTNENITLQDSVINPQACSDTFFRIFMESYDMSLSDQNLVKCYDYVPLLALIANDGIYLGYPRVVNGDKFEFHWEPKMPYYYDSPDGFIYGLTINGNGKFKINKTTGLFSDVSTQVHMPSNYKTIINERILSAVTMAISNTNEYHRAWKHKFYVPQELSDYSVVDFEGTTMLAFVQNLDIYTRKQLDYFGIGGTQTTRADKIVCYVEGGKRLYSYSSDIEKSGRPVSPIRIYDSVWEAAEQHYDPDLSRLS